MKKNTNQYNDEIKKLRENYNNQKELVETFGKAFRTNYNQQSAQELYFADKNNEPPSFIFY